MSRDINSITNIITNNDVGAINSSLALNLLVSPNYSIPNIIPRLFPLPYQRVTGMDLAAYCESLEILLSLNPKDLDAPNPSGFRPLHYACINGATETALYLLQMGVDPNRTPSGQGRPIYFAAYSGKKEILEALFDHGATLDENEQRTSFAFSPINAAMKRRNYEALEILLRRGKFVQSESGFSPLMLAIAMNLDSAIHPLLSKGLDPSVSTKDGICALYLACVRRSVEIVKLLSEKMTSNHRNQIGPNRTRPLHWAVVSGSYEIVKILMDIYSSEINIVDDMGNPAIFYITSFDKNFKEMERVLRLFCEKGAKIFIKSGGYMNLLHLLIPLANVPVSIIRLCLEYDCPAALPSPNGFNAIWFAKMLKRDDIVKELEKWAVYPSMLLPTMK